MAIKHIYEEKENEIIIFSDNRKYWVTLRDNNFINRNQDNKQETYINQIIKGGTFYDVLYNLINTSNFYSHKVNVNFDKNSGNIPKQEKEIIEGLVKKLEKAGIENKNLRNAFGNIDKICKNSDFNSINIL